MRILFITRKWAPAVGGMEVYSQRLTEELMRRHKVQVIALPGRSGGRPPSALSIMFFPLAVLRRCLAGLNRPGIIHLGDMAIWPLALIARLFAPRARIVLSAHGTDVSYSARGGFRGRLYGLYQRSGARLLHSASVIANSHATANASRSHGWNNASVVPLASDLRQPPHIQPMPCTILFAGRLIRQKGLNWFVREVLPRLPDRFDLVVAGTVWDREEGHALKDPRVKFLGPVSQAELVGLYSGALCVILPNLELPNGEFEGFGLVAVEGACCGGVVLAASTGGLTDAVRDRETGFLLPSESADAWATKIAQVAGWSPIERHAFINKSMLIAIAYYNWPRVADETCQIYAAALTGDQA